MIDLLLVEGNLVRLFGRGPETLGGETVVEVRAKVIHPSDGEENIHPELRIVLVGLSREIGVGIARFIYIAFD